jgi:predicted nucleic acid-binding Zn ribbon protein
VSDPLEPEGEARRVYLRLRTAMGDPAARGRDARKRRASAGREESVPFGAGRDPRGIGDVIGGLTAQLGWETQLAKGDLLLNWADLAGADTAKHSEPVSMEDGTLVVQCDSTAWATQLKTMRVRILAAIAERYPDAGIQNVRFLGPDVPSWKRGPKSVPGRGTRDTYG